MSQTTADRQRPTRQQAVANFFALLSHKDLRILNTQETLSMIDSANVLDEAVKELEKLTSPANVVTEALNQNQTSKSKK